MLYSYLVELLSRPELATKCLDNKEDRLFIADFLAKNLPQMIVDLVRKRLLQYPGEGYHDKSG